MRGGHSDGQEESHDDDEGDDDHDDDHNHHDDTLDEILGMMANDWISSHFVTDMVKHEEGFKRVLKSMEMIR